MTNNSLKVRLFVEQSLVAEELLTLTKDQSHYLRNVLRLHEGDRISLFNGIDGERRGRRGGRRTFGVVFEDS